MTRRRRSTIVAAIVVASLSVASSAVAAETVFHNGNSTSGKCNTAVYKGSIKIDDPFTSGLTRYGTAENWTAKCDAPADGTTTKVDCWWTTAGLVNAGRKIGSGLHYIVKGDTTYPYTTKTYWGYGTGSWVDSPVVCQPLVEGFAHSPSVRVYKTDGTFVTPTLYT